MTLSNPDPDRRDMGATPNDATVGSTKQKFQEDAREAKRAAGATARHQAEAGQERVVDEADALSGAIDAAASSLADHDRAGLARYARELSSHLAKAAGQLEARSVNDLAGDAKVLARDNPALFILGSVGVGFGLSRFFKASAEREQRDDDNKPRTEGDSRHEDAFHGKNDPSSVATNGDGRDLL
ncbi:hypothetical protein [Roseovarius sp.]|uniref:hypothetical protein n=1 Tax=Roseovarius sp. TaxID=1486281 RepID=UPI00356989CA